jgi:NADH-quinone oxidoreductase subunit M
MLILIILFFPLLVSITLFSFRKTRYSGLISLIGSTVEFLLVLTAFILFDQSKVYNFGFETDRITMSGIKLGFAFDGISLLLAGLTALLIPLIIISSFKHKYNNPGAFYGLIMLMQSALMGVFSSTDGLLFYIFWEASLLPVYFIISLWGGENRVKITLKFFIYTIFGSLFMLLALIWLYTQTPGLHTFNIQALYSIPLTTTEQIWIGLAFFIAFAVKIPIFPFHTWQPDTYTVAPASGSMLLSAIMLKMGIYGMLRLLLPLCPQFVSGYGIFLIVPALIGIIYASIIAINQQEIKRLIAYSSLAHVGMIAIAVLAINMQSLTGAIFQMFAHGINVFGLFFIADIIYVRTNKSQLNQLGGLATIAPKFAVFFMVVLLGSIALPLTNGFIGEYLMLSGIFQFQPVIAGIAGISVILSAVYMLRLYQKTMYGDSKTELFPDLSSGELTIAVIISALIIITGVFPGFFTAYIEPAVKEVLSKYVI